MKSIVGDVRTPNGNSAVPVVLSSGVETGNWKTRADMAGQRVRAVLEMVKTRCGRGAGPGNAPIVARRRPSASISVSKEADRRVRGTVPRKPVAAGVPSPDLMPRTVPRDRPPASLVAAVVPGLVRKVNPGLVQVGVDRVGHNGGTMTLLRRDRADPVAEIRWRIDPWEG